MSACSFQETCQCLSIYLSRDLAAIRRWLCDTYALFKLARQFRVRAQVLFCIVGGGLGLIMPTPCAVCCMSARPYETYHRHALAMAVSVCMGTTSIVDSLSGCPAPCWECCCCLLPRLAVAVLCGWMTDSQCFDSIDPRCRTSLQLSCSKPSRTAGPTGPTSGVLGTAACSLLQLTIQQMLLS